MHRRRLALGTVAALGLSTLAPQAVAAPTSARTVVALCDQIGQVTFLVQGPVDRAGAIVAEDPTGQVQATGVPTVTGTSAGQRLSIAGTQGATACHGAHLDGAAGSLLSARALTDHRIDAGATASLDLTLHVTTDEQAVLDHAGPRIVQAAAASHDPAGYGPVTTFPYQGQLASWFSGRSGSATIGYRPAGSQTISVYTKGQASNVTASIVKVQVMATVMYQAQQQHRGLTAWEKSRMVPMIRNSDNDATTQLWDHVGRGPAVARVMAAMGLRQTVPGSGSYWGLTVTTAPDQVVLVDHFARSNPVLTDANRAYGLSLMRTVNSSQDWGVTAGPGTDIAKKNGWLPRADGWHVNSVGYSHKAPQPYSIAVLTQSSSASMGTQIGTIEGASRIVWSASRRNGQVIHAVLGDRLYGYTATGSGHVAGPTAVGGGGWTSTNFVADVADTNGDGTRDLLARRQDGTVWLYRGGANGSLGSGRQVGHGFASLGILAAVGDVDGDGRPDLVGRDRQGRLLRYGLAGSSLVYRGVMGTGFRGMRQILWTGTGGRTGNLLAIRSDQTLWSYTSTGRALAGGTRVGTGWGARPVTSSTDLTGDGRTDVLLQSGRSLWTYPLAAGGHVTGRIAAGANGSGMRLLG